MPNSYIEDETLKTFAQAPESDETQVWELLAEAVSRLFDRECEVADEFFSEAGDTVSLKSYRADGTRYLQLFPYITGSITIISVDSTDLFEATVADRTYREKDGYLIFDTAPTADVVIDVTAKYGFTAVPSDIQFACIEQALQMWRKKDMAFAEISGVSSAVLQAEFSPSFSATSKRYRELYSSNTFFA